MLLSCKSMHHNVQQHLLNEPLHLRKWNMSNIVDALGKKKCSLKGKIMQFNACNAFFKSNLLWLGCFRNSFIPYVILRNNYLVVMKISWF